jgi:hypothetical protein
MHPPGATGETCYYSVYYPVPTSTKSGDDYFVAYVIFPLILMCRCGLLVGRSALAR